jgi:hypothetical protein
LAAYFLAASQPDGHETLGSHFEALGSHLAESFFFLQQLSLDGDSLATGLSSARTKEAKAIEDNEKARRIRRYFMMGCYIKLTFERYYVTKVPIPE